MSIGWKFGKGARYNATLFYRMSWSLFGLNNNNDFFRRSKMTNVARNIDLESAASRPIQAQADSSDEVTGLNFRTALDAHLVWKLHLMRIIEGESDDPLEPSTACRDDLCILGRWLYGPGLERFAHHQRFQQVIQAHAHFHRCAGQVLEMARAGKKQEAVLEISEGAFARASLEISRHLIRLWHDLGVHHK